MDISTMVLIQRIKKLTANNFSESNNRCSLYKAKGTIASVLLVFFASADIAWANAKVDAGVTAELVSQNVDTETNEEGFDVTNRVLRPFVAFNFDGRALDFSANASNNFVNRNLNDASVSTNYAEYDYAGSYQVIDNLFSVRANGSQRYLSQQLQSFIVDDFLLNGENLGKVQANSVGFLFNLPRGDLFGLTLSGNYQKSDSQFEQNSNIQNNFFDNENYNAGLNALSGTALKGFRTSINGSLLYNKRRNNQNFISQRVSVSNDINLYDNLGLAINGYYENNEIKSELIDASSGLREFYSGGIGLIWRSGDSRYIEVAYNQSTSEGLNGQDDQNDNFLSYRLDWKVSGRTRVSGSFTRRFYGEAGNFSLSHNLRNWRTSIRYQENVNSTSRLITTNETGLFVCENGSTDISRCTLSDSIEPELNEGQVLQTINIQGLDVNDRIILQKNLTAQTAVTRRRTTLSFLASVNNVEEFELDRDFETRRFQTSISFGISRHSRISFSHDLSKIETIRSGNFVEQTTNRYNVSYSRTLSRRLTTKLSISELQRDGTLNVNNGQFRGLNGPLTDRRITFGLSYNFGNRSRD